MVTDTQNDYLILDMDGNTIERVLDVIEQDIAPKTLEGVKSGCKLFGAAILRKSDLSLVLASTNTETANPLLHGEITAINDFYNMKDHPPAKECIFIATHEPCSLCLSGITWGGFDNFSYFFTYEDSRDEFATPYDIDILEAVFRVPEPNGQLDPHRPLYNSQNKYFHSTDLKKRIKELNDPKLLKRIKPLYEKYSEFSAIYERSKGGLINP